jgi:hypothetical protein
MWLLLNEVAGQLGVEVRLETLEDGEEFSAHGGLCRLGRRLVAFVDRRLSPAGLARSLGMALMGLGLEGVYLKPAVREFLASLGEGTRQGDDFDQA